jgi:hypothetical protein
MRDDLRKITERVQILEGRMSRLTALVKAVMAWFARRRVNAVSRQLSGPEVIQLKAQMRAHGVAEKDEDESRDERRDKARVRR